MTQDSFRKTILLVIYLLCIPVIVFTARLVSRRTLSVSETALAGQKAATGAFEVTLEPGSATGFDVKIPLPSDVTQDDVTFENRYLEHALYLSLSTGQRGFYIDRSVICNNEKVTGATCLLQDGNTIGLLLNTDTLYDPVFRMESNAVTITLTPPYETADHVIVIDPAYSGAGGDVALSLAVRLRETLLASPVSCRVFLTRTDASVASDEAVSALIEESHASRFLRLDMPEGEAALSASLTLYDGFYIRDYGNVPFAADVMRALSAVEGLRADGIEAVSADARLAGIRIPALSAHIEGVRSSFGEDEKLLSELASALCTAIRLGFRTTDEAD